MAPGYLPERERIDVEVVRFFPDSVEDKGKIESNEQATVWILSSLARKHTGHSYRVRRRAEELQVHSWVIEQENEEGQFGEWFQLPEAQSEQFRLYLHAYPREQVGCDLLFNVFDYPHKQLGTRRGRYKGLTPLKKATKPILDALADVVDNDVAAAQTFMQELGHPISYSIGEPSR
jgi:hypothetical protein